MRIKLILSSILMTLLLPLTTMLAMAGPEGIYDVEGTNPGNGSKYSGTVEIVQTGDTYGALWVIGGQEYKGTGIGAANIKGVSTMGAANENDNVITISYISGGSFGLAFYVEQDNGTWKGIWTYGGTEAIGTEVWYPR